jgi:hypothetical protein
MGDLNDGPYNKSVKYLAPKQKKPQYQSLGCLTLEEMAQKGQGTIAHRDAWDIFDQIMLSETLYCSATVFESRYTTNPFDTKQRTI